jgi:translocation protein SEC66
VQRIFRVRDDKAALTALLQKGSIGDDLWTSFQAAEKEVEAEIIEVVAEANSFREGWGQIIFQTASEILQNERMKRVFHDIPKVKAEQGSFF